MTRLLIRPRAWNTTPARSSSIGSPTSARWGERCAAARKGKGGGETGRGARVACAEGGEIGGDRAEIHAIDGEGDETQQRAADVPAQGKRRHPEKIVGELAGEEREQARRQNDLPAVRCQFIAHQ